MDTRTLTAAELAAFQKQLGDFVAYITHNEAWIIHKFFADDVDTFYDAPRKYREFKATMMLGLPADVNTIYRNIRLFNLVTKNQGANVIRALICKIPGTQKRFPWKMVKEAISLYLIQKHGRLTWNTTTSIGKVRTAQTYNNHYSIGRDAMKAIFADPELLAKVLSFQSSYYSSRCRHFIQKTIAQNTKQKMDKVLDAVIDDIIEEG